MLFQIAGGALAVAFARQLNQGDALEAALLHPPTKARVAVEPVNNPLEDVVVPLEGADDLPVARQPAEREVNPQVARGRRHRRNRLRPHQL